MTNAVKYGSLSSETGRVLVRLANRRMRRCTGTGERKEDRRWNRRTSKASEASSSLNVSKRFLQATSHDFPRRDLNAQSLLSYVNHRRLGVGASDRSGSRGARSSSSKLVLDTVAAGSCQPVSQIRWVASRRSCPTIS